MDLLVSVGGAAPFSPASASDGWRHLILDLNEAFLDFS